MLALFFHDFPPTDRWSNRGGKSYLGPCSCAATSSRINNGIPISTSCNIATTEPHILPHGIITIRGLLWLPSTCPYRDSYQFGSHQDQHINTENNMPPILHSKFIQRHTQVATALQVAQDRAKQRHDKHHTPLTFQPGDRVWLQMDKQCFKGRHHKLHPIVVWTIHNIGSHWRECVSFGPSNTFGHT
jgi:hypothetical protein